MCVFNRPQTRLRMLRNAYQPSSNQEEEKPQPSQYGKDNNIDTSKKSLAAVLKSISDDKSLSIFQTIANASSSTEQISLTRLSLTRKQYYSKISAMMKVGLIKRQSGRYYLTPFGKVIYCCTMTAKNALDNYYNLKAIEATEVSGLPSEEIGKLIDVLIDNQQIKEFITKKC
jgi:predicted transcriptional regulator